MPEDYESKRNLAATPEPPPRPATGRQGPLVFVIHKHSARQLHYDFRLELDGWLKSWAVPKGPSFDPERKNLAVLVEDHPFDYRSFEGVIPKGQYGGGEVIIWDQGTYSPDEDGEFSFGSREEAEKRMREGLEKGKISVFLRGQKLRGSWTLVKMRQTEKNWLLIKHKDKYASADRDALAEERSVISGLTNNELKTVATSANKTKQGASPEDFSAAKRTPFPTSLTPMLATTVKEPFDGPEWLFEPKLDGFRTIALIKKGKVKLLSRNGLDVSSKYASLLTDLGQQPASQMVLDGEIIALDDKGKQCFQCLQHYLQTIQPARKSNVDTAAPATPLLYYVFDLLHLDGYDLKKTPLFQRKHLLQSVLQASNHIRLVDYFPKDGKTTFQAAVNNGLEGVVAKQRDSTYEPGKRSQEWLKVKAVQSDDFIVGGYTLGSGNRAPTFGALLLGRRDDSGKLVFTGHVGTGFDEPGLKALRRQLDALKSDQSPFAEPVPLNAPTVWVRPEMVVEVKYDQFTEEGYLRAPVFLRVRDDKPAGEVRKQEIITVRPREKNEPKPSGDLPATVAKVVQQIRQAPDNFTLEVEGNKINLTHLEKELWPPVEGQEAVTKRDLLIYLAEVSPFMLPHFRDRPLTMSRYPGGIEGEQFYQKHWESPLPPFVDAVDLPTDNPAGRSEYLMCHNLATLLWLGQLANLELHTWFSRVNPKPDLTRLKSVDSIIKYPDFIIFDIDPYLYSGKETKGAEPEYHKSGFDGACQAARWLKEALDGLSLPSFIKTSGKTGLHIYVPIQRRLDYKAVRAAAQTICGYIRQKHPQEITLEWAVEKRTGKIFLDYNQNVLGKTLAAVYSPRPSPGATVSTPLRWEELGQSYPTAFTVFSVPGRLQKTGDLWAKMMDARADLAQALKLQGKE